MIARFYLALAIVLALACAALAFAQGLPSGETNPRTLGFKAVLNVYWVSPKTLEITAMDSYYYPTLEKCRDAQPKAETIAQSVAGQGDVAIAECKAMKQVGETVAPDDAQGPPKKPLPKGTVTL